MSDILRQVVARNRAGEAVAIPSVCSAHPEVLVASLLRAEAMNRAVVVEATSNQVNQDGGYTGMRPQDFIRFVNKLADDADVDRGRIVFGGDHLGPQVWRKGPADRAMARARDLVVAYVAAGFGKVHLDCSEGCAGEPAQVSDRVSAERAAALASACEATGAEVLYVIGTEVPPPGGARAGEDGHIVPTTPAGARATLLAHGEAFAAAGLSSVVPRVAGLVVQPGVEFSPMAMHHLPIDRNPGLRAEMMQWPGLCLEAHSTDYQHPAVFPRLAELGFAFQKVGPALTFAWRQAIYGLDQLATLAGWQQGPALAETMEALMLAEPAYWQGHYQGNSADIRVERHFGLADRIRYYWPKPEAQAALGRLMALFEGRRLPDALLWQAFAPDLLARAEALAGGYAGKGLPAAQAMARCVTLAAVQLALDPYLFAPPGGS